MHSLMETWVPCMSQCMFSSHLISVPILLFRMCSCISTCIYVHPTTHVSSTPYALLHGNLDSSVWQCVCPRYPTTGPTTLIKMCTCISTCIHVQLTYNVCFIFLNNDMETWVPLCGSVCMHVCCSQLACGPSP